MFILCLNLCYFSLSLISQIFLLDKNEIKWEMKLSLSASQVLQIYLSFKKD